MQLFCSLHPASFHNAFWQFPGAVYPDFCIFRTAVMQFFASASVTVQHEMRLQSSRFFILHACRRILFAILWHGKAPPAISRPKFHVIDAQSAPFCNPCRALPQNALQIPSRKYAKNRSGLILKAAAVTVSLSSSGSATVGIHWITGNSAVRFLHEFLQLILKNRVSARFGCGIGFPAALLWLGGRLHPLHGQIYLAVLNSNDAYPDALPHRYILADIADILVCNLRNMH